MVDVTTERRLQDLERQVVALGNALDRVRGLSALFPPQAAPEPGAKEPGQRFYDGQRVVSASYGPGTIKGGLRANGEEWGVALDCGRKLWLMEGNLRPEPIQAIAEIGPVVQPFSSMAEIADRLAARILEKPPMPEPAEGTLDMPSDAQIEAMTQAIYAADWQITADLAGAEFAGERPGAMQRHMRYRRMAVAALALAAKMQRTATDA